MRALTWLGLAAGAALALAGCNTTPGGQGLVQQTACADFVFPVYFQANSDKLTPEAMQLIAQSATRAKSCAVVGVSITGLEGASADLAGRRVAEVDKALAANGINAQATVVSAPPQGFGLLHRRIEVDVRLAAPRP